MTVVFEQNRAFWHALGDEEVATCFGFGEPIAFLATAGDDDQWGDAFAIEREDFVESGLKDWSWATVVLGGSEDDEGLDRAGLVVAGLPVDGGEE